MLDGLVDAVDHAHRDDGVEVFGAPVLLGGRLHARIGAPAPPHRRAVRSRRRPAPSAAAAAGAAHAARSTSSVSAAPQMPVRRSLAFTTIARAMSRSASRSTYTWHSPSRWPITGTRASACTRSTRLRPPRGTITLIAGPGPRASCPTAARSVVGTSWMAAAGRPASRSPLDQAGVDGGAGEAALRAAAQDHRIGRLQAQRARIGRHVGTALVDDADDAQRHAHALDPQAVGPRPFARSRRRWDRPARRSPRCPRAMASTRLSSSCSRSSMAALRPRARAASMSRALAARICARAARGCRARRPAAPHCALRRTTAPAPARSRPPRGRSASHDCVQIGACRLPRRLLMSLPLAPDSSRPVAAPGRRDG